MDKGSSHIAGANQGFDNTSEPYIPQSGESLGFPYPFAVNPHPFITRRYSGSANKKNQLIFRDISQSEHPTTRELLKIEIYPLQKGVLKDIISPVRCNNLVVVVVSRGGV